MQAIISPLNPNDTGNEVSNLQAALLFLLDKNIFKTFQAPDHPTEKEINGWKEMLKDENADSLFSEGTQQLLFIFQLQQGLGENFKGAVEEITAAKLNEVLKALGAFDDAEKDIFMVKGIIRQGDSGGYAQAIVKVYDSNIRGKELLGETKTNETGYYEMLYKAEEFSDTDKGNADLSIQVFDAADKFLIESGIYYNARNILEINLSIPLPPQQAKPEWELFNDQVLPLLKGQDTGNDLLPEKLESKDFDYIAKKTGLNTDHLRLWSLAYSRSKDPGIKDENRLPPEIFYGWFRMGLSAELKDLWATANDELSSALQDAAGKNVIPLVSDELFAKINKSQVDFHLLPAPDGEKASVGDIINLTIKDKTGIDWFTGEKKKIFIDISKQLDSDAPDFLDKIQAITAVPEEQIALQKSLKLDKITMSNPALMEALHPLVANETDASLKPLATIPQDEWIDLAYTHGVPSGINLNPEEYAIQLANDVEDRLPTASLTNKINSGDILFNQPGIEKITTLLKAQPDFDIVKDDIAAVAVEYNLDDESKGLLKSLQNLKKMGTRWEDTDAYINNRIDSVAKIVEYSPEQLTNILKDDVAPEQVATVHANAIAAQRIGIGMMGYLQPLLYSMKANVMQSFKLPEDIDPNLRTLFGTLEQCACDPCLSVLSPAAYYTDLLRFIDSSGNAGEVLKSIRPDLYDLELSCDNSQIEMPYIDLSLEILENKVAFPLDVPIEPGVKAFEILPDKSVIIAQALIDTIKSSVEGETGQLIAEDSGDSAWVVRDTYRRWAISAVEENLKTDRPKDYFDIKNFNVPDLLQWLDSPNPGETNIPPGDLKSAFENELKKRLNSNIFSNTLLIYQIHKTQTGYNIEYETKAALFNQDNLDPGKSDFVFKIDDDDNNNIIKTFGSKTVQAVTTQLEAGIVPQILKFGQQSQFIKVEPNSSGTGYNFTYSNHLYLQYYPLKLTINGLTYQSTQANTNLFVQPQNRNPLAYVKLDNATFPPSLPYNQPLIETRLLLEKAGTPRLNLIDANTTYDEKFSNEEWIREQVGISATQQFAITADNQTLAIYGAWGLNITNVERDVFEFSVYDSFQGQEISADTGLELLQKVSVIIGQAGIEYTDLQDLLKSRFINSANVFIPANQDCDPTKMSLQNSDELFFDRMQRFIRLWRILGWSIAQVDAAIMSDKIGNGKLGDNTIKHIAQIKALQEQLGLPFDIVIAFFNPFTETVTNNIGGNFVQLTPLYKEIFQNKLIQNPADDFNLITVSSKLWAELLPFIAAALGILQPDLESFLNSGIADFAAINLTSKVNLSSLKLIWQNLSLARAMQLSLTDYAAACKLIYPSTSPFNSPFDLLKFIDEIKFVKQSGISLQDLEKLLSRENEESILPIETAAQILKGLQKELQTIALFDFGKFHLEKSQLDEPGFIIPKTETERWQYWGLTEIGRTDNWSVPDPLDASKQLLNLPLKLLQEEDVLLQQLTILFPEILFSTYYLSQILQTSFISPNGSDEIKIEPASVNNPKKMIRLSSVHLDRLIKFLNIKKSTDLSINDLDLIIKSVVGLNNEPLAYDLNELIDAAQDVITKQPNVIANYFANWYKQDIVIVNKLIVPQQLKNGSVIQPVLRSFLNFFVSFDFWNEKNVVNEMTLKDSDAYKFVIKLQKLLSLNLYWKASTNQFNLLRKWNGTDYTGYSGIIPDQLSITQYPEDPTGVDIDPTPANIDYRDWKRTTLLFKNIQVSPEMEAMLSNYLKGLSDGVANAKIMDARKILAEAFAMKQEDVDAGAELQNMDNLLPALPLTPMDRIESNFDPIKLGGLINYLSQLQKLGLNTSQYADLVTEPATFFTEPSYGKSVRIARQVLLARYGAGNYADALKEVNNNLRVQERDRLVDYLVWKENVPDANGLYEKYLIDVEMSACMNTTRLLQSTTAAQLFVHRCLLNLQRDPLVSPHSFYKKRWEWTQNYRVWEANRKVFLYPENWLYPELRDDKTATFRTFETALTQNEASDKNAKDALINYTEELVDLSNIAVMGMHTYYDIDRTVKIFQVGRTINPPYSFYWREFSPFNKWTGWEKIDQDLSANHLIPFRHDENICIAWPNITTKSENSNDTYEIGLSWIRRTNKGWTERKKSADKINIEKLFNRDEKSMFLFRLKEQLSELNKIEIELYVPQSSTSSVNIDNNVGAEISLMEDASITGSSVSKININLNCYIRYYDTGRVIKTNDAEFSIKGIYKPNDQNQIEALPPEFQNPVTVENGNNVYSTNYYLIDPSKEIKIHGNVLNQDLAIYFFNPDHNALTPNYDNSKCTIEVKIHRNGGYEFSSPLFNINEENHYLLSWDIVLDEVSNVKDPESIFNQKEYPLKMVNKGAFVLFSDKDGVWSGDNLAPSITPASNTYFFSSGLRESRFSNPNQETADNVSNDAPLNLSDNAGIDIHLTKKSKQNEKYFAVRASNLTPLGFHALHIEEGNTKMLVLEPDASSSVQTTGPVMVTVTGYSEAQDIKSNASKDVSKLFEIQFLDSFLSESFGLKGLEDYKDDNNVLPISAYAGFTPFPFPFQPAMPYALYNWEVFYHLPIAAACFLSKQHRFEEARKWFHYIFDPTTNDPSTGKERFWRFLPFRNNNQEASINELLNQLSKPGSGTTNIQGQIDAWLVDPFSPFAVARLRINAYEWFTVTAYIKNLIEWGDQLFRRETRESLNEATLLYLMASDILGRRPMPIPSNSKSSISLSYREFKGKGIDDFGNTWVTLLDTPYGKQLLEQKSQGFGAKPADVFQLLQLSSIGSAYFCVPPNEKLPELWDTVADRLFKIRNCQNFDGVIRDLPLLDPPIDPELLIRAKAAGVSVADALSDMYAPPPLYRFNMVVQKAIDLCNEVKGLGGAILSAIEKKEAEHLNLLRSGQEIEMQKLVAAVKQEQINEAAANIEALNKSRENIIARVMYLQRQMGSAETTLDADGVPVLNESYITQPLANLDITVADFAGLGLIQSESDQVVFMQTNNIFNLISGGYHTASGIAHTLGASLAVVPAPADGPAKVANSIGDALTSYGTFFNTLASHFAMLEKRSGMMAGWQRRRDEWLYQAKTAVAEIWQIDKQIIASEIRKAIAEKELDNHYKQIEHTQTIDDYVRNQKFSNETLYTWMESRLSIVYKSAFDMAYEQAKKAEKAFGFELGDDLTHFITPGYCDTMQKGLLAGEGLMLDLKRMEIAYMDRSKRDFEITKHISLAQLNPLILLQLKATGTCNFDIPEVLFDMDFPGHYFRRIKSVSLSIPCIAGPYTSVSATLSLTGNKLRRNPKSPYTEDSLEIGYTSNQSSIATSHGQNDGGMFELNFRDERYLPFEGCGAISSWNLTLPDLNFAQFDYNTISDVVVHLKYTSRQDSALKSTVIKTLNDIFKGLTGKVLGRLFSLKNDFPDEFYKLMHSLNNLCDIPITENLFPYFLKGKNLNMANGGAKIFIKTKTVPVTLPTTPQLSLNNIKFGKVTSSPPPITSPVPLDYLLSEAPASEDSKDLPEKRFDFKLSGLIIEANKKWQMQLTVPADAIKIDDVLILLNYTI